MSESSTPQGGIKSSSLAVIILSICVICYFAFPVAFVLPLMLVFGRIPPPGLREVVRTVFRPIVMLSEQFPAYRNYLMWQERLFTNF